MPELAIKRLIYPTSDSIFETMEDTTSLSVTSPTRGMIFPVCTDEAADSSVSLRRPMIYTFSAPLRARARAIIRPIPWAWCQNNQV